jgi:putative methyltransferase (TIGR04325 family)
MTIKKIIISVLPPFISLILKNVLLKTKFSKSFETWDGALKHCSSYNKKEIFDKTKNAARLVRDGAMAYERDSVLFNKVQYDYALLFALLFIANKKSQLHLIDFGGSLGTSYRQNKKYLDALSIPIKWGVVEQSEFVEIGINEFQNDTLKFYDNLSQINFNVDVVLMGSSLCYCKNPYDVLTDIMEIEPNFILIVRTPFSEEKEDKISIQYVPKHIYDASYPYWTLSKENLINFLLKKYKLFEEWDDTLQAYPTKSFGLLFKKC